MSTIANSTIEEAFTLPSHGKIYTEDVKEHFTMRSMTVNEEMLRLAPSDHNYEVLCNIIDRCMVDGPGISAYDMCIGDYIYCLYMLRIVTYGPKYKIAPECRYCSTIQDATFDLRDLEVKEYSDDIEKYIELDLPVSNRHIRLMPASPRLLDNVNDKINMYKRKISQDMNSVVMCEIMSCIDTVDGIKLNEAKLELFVRSLSMQDVNTILNYSTKLNGSIGINTKIIITCDMCGLTSEADLAITSEFFRPTLDI